MRIAAGLLDLVENAALRRVVDGDPSPWAAVATVATIPKWVLLALAVPMAVYGLLAALRHLWIGLFPSLERRPVFPVPHVLDMAVEAGFDTADPHHHERRARGPGGSPWPNDQVGVCFSGGGIRGASFALGALQGLQERTPADEPATDGVASVYATADYLSTVSGGGYAGTAFRSSPTSIPTVPFPSSPAHRTSGACGIGAATCGRHRRRGTPGSPRGSS